MSDDLAESMLRMKGEVVIVPAERMPSATAPVWLRKSGFIFMHVACLGVFLTGVNVQDLALCGSVYLLQVVGITAAPIRAFVGGSLISAINSSACWRSWGWSGTFARPRRRN